MNWDGYQYTRLGILASVYNPVMPLVDQIQKDIVTAMKAKDEARRLAAELRETSPQCSRSQITDFLRHCEHSRSQLGGGRWDGVAHLCPVSPGADRSSTLGQFVRPCQYAERLS